MALFKQTRELYDPIRKKWVAATSEEKVRQHLLLAMIEKLSYPKELLAVEKKLDQLPHLQGRVSQLPDRRVDLLCFANGIDQKTPLSPLLAIECKEGDLGDHALEQLIGYNEYIQAPFLALASKQGIRFVYRLQEKGQFRFLSFLPQYGQLLRALKNDKHL